MLTTWASILLLLLPHSTQQTRLSLNLQAKWSEATLIAQTFEAFRSLDEYGFMSSAAIHKWASGVQFIGRKSEIVPYCAAVGSNEDSCEGVTGVLGSELLRRSLEVLISNKFYYPAIEFSREKSKRELRLLNALTKQELRPGRCPHKRWHSVYELMGPSGGGPETSERLRVAAVGVACELADINKTITSVGEDEFLQSQLLDFAVSSSDLYVPIFDEAPRLRRIIHSNLRDADELTHMNAFCQVPGNAFRHSQPLRKTNQVTITNWAASLTLKNPEYSTVNEAQEPADAKQKMPSPKTADDGAGEDEAEESLDDYLSWAPAPDAPLSEIAKERKAMAKLGGGTLWFLSEESRKVAEGSPGGLCEEISQSLSHGARKLWCLSKLISEIPSHLRTILSDDLTSDDKAAKMKKIRRAVGSMTRLHQSRWNSLSVNGRVIGTAFSQSATAPSLQLAFPFHLITEHILPMALREEFMHQINATEPIIKSILRSETIRDESNVPKMAKYFNDLTLSHYDIPSSFTSRAIYRWDYRPLLEHLQPVVQLTPMREEFGASISAQLFVRSIRTFALSRPEALNWAFRVADVQVVIDPKRDSDVKLALKLLSDSPPGIRLFILSESGDRVGERSNCYLKAITSKASGKKDEMERWLKSSKRIKAVMKDTQADAQCDALLSDLRVAQLRRGYVIVNGWILDADNLTISEVTEWIQDRIAKDMQSLAIALMLKFATLMESEVEGSGLLDRLTSSQALRLFLNSSPTPGSSFTHTEDSLEVDSAPPALADFFLTSSLPSIDHEIPFQLQQNKEEEEASATEEAASRWRRISTARTIDGYYLTLSQSFANVTNGVKSADAPPTMIVWLTLDVDRLGITDMEDIRLDKYKEHLPERLPLATQVRISLIQRGRLCNPANGLREGDLDNLLCAQPLPQGLDKGWEAARLIVGSSILREAPPPSLPALKPQKRIDLAIQKTLKRLPALISLQGSMMKKAAVFCHAHSKGMAGKLPALCPQAFSRALTLSDYSPAEKQHAAFLWWQFLSAEILQGNFDEKLIEEGAAENELFSLASIRPLRLSAAWDSDVGSLVKLKAIIDPLSKWGQYMMTALAYIHSHLKVDVQLLLNPRWSYRELPINRWSRLVLAPPISSKSDQEKMAADFDQIVTDEVLVAAVEPPPHWHAESREAVLDMDNLRSRDLNESGATANYELKGFFVEGKSHGFVKSLQTVGAESRDVLLKNDEFIGANALRLRSAPLCRMEAGKATETCVKVRSGHKDETITMATPNYFQFKVPLTGTFEVSLLNNRSITIDDPYATEKTEATSYQLSLIDLKDHGHREIDFSTIEMRSFKERTMALNILGTPQSKSSSNLLSSFFEFWRTPARSQESEDDDQTVNIFSLASGHMYERLLRIMTLSVERHTNRKLRFWILENFLSDNFKEKAANLEKKYQNISFEYVSYKWPPFLRPQTEKQRQIWANKILFLDVLFPLSLKRLIYIDADQIVRGDIGDLWDLDLQDKVYGFTPFCQDKEETAQFRFWEKGYWRDHLKGKPYHISALFIVDLDAFRRRQIGPRLRAIYNALSRDPHSLANLDQDLPNYAQESIPIFSLPQEWLWCETWCSEESKARAKTIDLCNNPLTHESKLAQARRIVPEWIEYDRELESKFNETFKESMETRPSRKDELR